MRFILARLRFVSLLRRRRAFSLWFSLLPIPRSYDSGSSDRHQPFVLLRCSLRTACYSAIPATTRSPATLRRAARAHMTPAALLPLGSYWFADSSLTTTFYARASCRTARTRCGLTLLRIVYNNRATALCGSSVRAQRAAAQNRAGALVTCCSALNLPDPFCHHRSRVPAYYR